MQELDLDHNCIGDKEIEALVLGLKAGVLPRLTELSLGPNAIGDRGICAFSNALNSADRDRLEAQCPTEVAGADGATTSLLIDGVLPRLERLLIGRCDLVSDEGWTALACALEAGALPKLSELYAGKTASGHKRLASVCSSRGISIS